MVLSETPNSPSPIHVCPLKKKKLALLLNFQTKAPHSAPECQLQAVCEQPGAWGVSDLVVKSTFRNIKLKCVTDRRGKSRRP